MRKTLILLCGMLLSAQSFSQVCTPDGTTTFDDYDNKAFTISNDALGTNTLYSQCSNMSNQQTISTLNGCGALSNPIDGLGLNPTDRFLYGLMPTDAMGVGAHIQFDTFPFPSPGQPGDMMKADAVDVYRIGNDGGYQRIGAIQPPTEDAILPAGEEQVIPIVHSASSFNAAGNMFVLGYKSNYESSANLVAGTAEVLYKAPKIMIGQVSSAALTAANGGNIPTAWLEADTAGDATCAAVMNQFAVRTNTFSQCVVADYLANGNEQAAVQACLSSTSVLDYGIHDFAVSPANGNFYALDSMTYDDRDVLIEVNAGTMQASCTEFADAGNSTGVLTSLMFSQQNKLVAIFANENTGRWIDVNTGVITTLTDNIDPYPFGDGSSIPFLAPLINYNSLLGTGNYIFGNGFEADLIFINGFEGDPLPPTCPAF
jgi:hypothetical protein